MSDSGKSEVNWGMLCHLGGLAAYIGIPFGNIIVPLIIWLAKRDTDSYAREEGKESLNFNISFTLYGLLVGLLCFAFIGYFLLPVFFLIHLVLAIWATLQAQKGKSVHYPWTLRFIN